MSNPTNKNCSNDIAQLQTTDYRPSKALYENIKNNNTFRLYLQRNANTIRQMQLNEFEGKMACSSCEKQSGTIKPFDKTYSERLRK